jgi:hypothetical protein
MEPRWVGDKILKSLVRVKYDFGDGEDMRETGFEKDTDEVEDKWSERRIWREDVELGCKAE